MTFSTPSSLPVLGLCLAGLLAAGCGTTRERNEVVRLVKEGQYAAAVELAEERVQERPKDEGAQHLLEQAQAALYLDLGRTAVFEGESEEALAYFRAADQLEPDNHYIQSWLRKARLELAHDWLIRAQGYTSDDLEAAAEAFEQALYHDPGNARAELGLARVMLMMNYREGRSLTYYQKGVDAFQDLLLDVAQRDFGISDDLDENEPARRRREEARHLLAEERLAQARSFEEQGFFFPAKTEYRLAVLLDPRLEEAQLGYDRMDREGRAIRKLGEAEMHRLRGDLDKARIAILEADVLSEAQGDRVSLAESEVEEAEYERMYLKARGLEKEYDFSAAIAAYDELLERAEFYEDAIARRQTLIWLVTDAQELYEKASSAESDEEAADFLRQIDEFVWPGYRDVRERLAELTGAPAPAPAPAPGSSED